MFGLVISLGIATTIFMNVAVPEITAIIPNSTRQTVNAAVEGFGNTLFEQLPEHVQSDVLAVVAKSIAKVFYLNVVGGACGFATAIALKWEHLVL